MRYQFVDEIVFRHLGRSRLPLLLKVPDCRLEGIAAAGDRLPPAGDPARGARA
jgi:hypothetical protein